MDPWTVFTTKVRPLSRINRVFVRFCVWWWCYILRWCCWLQLESLIIICIDATLSPVSGKIFFWVIVRKWLVSLWICISYILSACISISFTCSLILISSTATKNNPNTNCDSDESTDWPTNYWTFIRFLIFSFLFVWYITFIWKDNVYFC